MCMNSWILGIPLLIHLGHFRHRILHLIFDLVTVAVIPVFHDSREAVHAPPLISYDTYYTTDQNRSQSRKIDTHPAGRPIILGQG